MLNAYDAVLLLTLGAMVTLGCMCVARLCRHDFWVALPAMAAVVQIFVVGRLWIFNGYPTFDLPIAAATAAVILSWRATLRPWLQYFAIAGLALVSAYTWYPVIVLSAPALIVAVVRLMKASPGRSRTLSLVVFACTGISFLAPFVHFGNEVHKFTFAYASSGANARAIFTPGTPWVQVVLSIIVLLLLLLVLMRFKGRKENLGLLAAPAVIGGLGVLVLVASEIRASNHVSYYGHKFADGVFGMCLVALVTVLVSSFATSKLRRRLSAVAVAALACLASVALLEIDGYVGPFASVDNTALATGFRSHKLFSSTPENSGEASALLASAHMAQDQVLSGKHWAFIDPESRLNCREADEWFFALSNERLLVGYGEWLYLPCLVKGADTVQATYVVTLFPDPVASHIHLFVTAPLARAIIARSRVWGSPGVLHVLPSRAAH